jgi:hypothetical protein
MLKYILCWGRLEKGGCSGEQGSKLEVEALSTGPTFITKGKVPSTYTKKIIGCLCDKKCMIFFGTYDKLRSIEQNQSYNYFDAIFGGTRKQWEEHIMWGTFEGFHWELWQQQLPKSWYNTSMETNLGTIWLSYHGACCPYLALKVIILIIGKFGKTMVI